MQYVQRAAFVAASALAATVMAESQYVISISIDGMGSSYTQSLFNTNSLPNLKRIVTEGASTLNARTDANYAITLPNHTDMVTGRGVSGDTGHNWTNNVDPAPGATLETNKGSYVASMFDVAHDNGLSTAMWSGKTKFSLFDTSYNVTNGAADVTGLNNGKDKIDYASIGNATPASSLTSNFVSYMSSTPARLSFVHFQDPDAAGHASGWGSTGFNNAMIAVDTQIGNILNLVETNPTLVGKTTIVVTADHGGHSGTHGDMSNPLDYTIPFMVWGKGATPGDLYAMNTGARLDPGTANVSFAASGQPIRNGELGNLSLDLLGLGAIPGSTINAAQNLAVPEPTSIAAISLAGIALLRRRRA